MLNPDSNDKARLRFIQEAAIMCQFNHECSQALWCSNRSTNNDRNGIHVTWRPEKLAAEIAVLVSFIINN